MSLQGCSDDYPRDWPKLVAVKGTTCPDITGKYRLADWQPYQVLAQRLSPHDYQPINSYLTLTGDAQIRLHVTPATAKNAADWTRPGDLERYRDYQCKSGWLTVNWPSGMSARNDNDQNEPTMVEKTMSFAKNAEGQLVIRIDTIGYEAFSVWCGDGCKYVRVPFTETVKHEWKRWAKPDEVLPEEDPVPGQPKLTKAQAQAQADALNADRLKREAAMARRSVEIAEDEREFARFLAAIPPGIQVWALTRQEGGYVADITCRDADAVAEVVSRLQQASGFGGVTVKETRPYTQKTIRAYVAYTPSH